MNTRVIHTDFSHSQKVGGIRYLSNIFFIHIHLHDYFAFARPSFPAHTVQFEIVEEPRLVWTKFRG